MMRYSLIATCLVLSGMGCVNLEPPPDPTRYFVMNGPEAAGSEGGFAVDVRSVALEPYLKGPRIVVRLSENEVLFSDVHRWAEPLEENIESVLEGYLALSPIGTVANRPMAENTFVVHVYVDRFEGELPDVARFVSNWKVLDVAGNILARGKSDHALNGWNGTDYSQLVSMLESTVELLADEVASSL